MNGLGVYGQYVRGAMGPRMSGLSASSATSQATKALEIGGTAFALSALSAAARSHNITLGPVVKDGKLLGVPFTLAGSLLFALGAWSGVGGQKAQPHLMNMAYGSLAAWLTTLGVKAGYAGTGQTPAIAGYGPQWSPVVGAAPETERLLREAGL